MPRPGSTFFFGGAVGLAELNESAGQPVLVYQVVEIH
jgi:hypothetical protein